MARAITLLILPAVPGAAYAGDPVALSANLGATSDYRFRGVSQSNRHPAVQGGIDANFASGLFVGSWASSIASYGGAHVEVDLYAGYAANISGIDFTATIYGYAYPGGHGVNYVELQGLAAHEMGPFTLQVEVDVTPHQANAASNVYVAAGASIPVSRTDLSFFARAGHEDGGYDGKWDWEAGMIYAPDLWTFSLSYVDSDSGGADGSGRLGQGALMLAARRSF